MEIFPEKLQITIYLTKLPGLLFYGFHKTDDVVCILEEKDIILIYQGQHYKTSLQQLCKCDPCLYQPITFTFQVNDVIKINCNGHEVVKNKLPSMMDGHLIHSFVNETQKEYSYLYLINIPPYINHTYQYETLAGCIQEVKYRDIVLEILRNDPSLSQCTPHCKLATCNGGRCLETYEHHTLCDCQFAYLNGDRCNLELWHGFNRNTSLRFQILKLTWISSVEEILVVSDDKSHSITVLYKDKMLLVSFSSQESQTTVAIDKNYSSTNLHIMIISVDKLMVNITYKSHKMRSWRKVTTLLPEYLFNFQYSTITFLNNKHTEEGDVVYKTSRSNDKWMSFRHITTFGPFEENISQLNKKITKLEIVIIFLSVILSVVIIGFIILAVKFKKITSMYDTRCSRESNLHFGSMIVEWDESYN